MGYFLATTAFRSNSVPETAQAISEYLLLHGVQHDILSSPQTRDNSTDALVFAPQNQWVVVLWPNYFNLHDFPLAAAVGKTRPWLISTIHVYDSDYWEHFAVQGTEELHSFCSRPGFWAEEPLELERVAKFRPDPQRFAAAVNVPGSLLQPYLVDADALSDEGAKAHSEDQFPLDDFWVFTDFWRRAGIVYPDPPGNPASVLRLSKDFGKRLPNG